MASKQDILSAIKHLDVFLKVPALKGAEVRLNKNGRPFVYAGGFNLVFQLSQGSKKWAFRVWHVPMGELKDRYLAISRYLTKSNLNYFADFIYDEKALLVDGELKDTVRMEWIDGIVLKDYIEKNLSDRAKLEQLANDFLVMTEDLKENKISHGDLQEGNIIIDNSGKIKLVDYDSICIPEIEGQAALVTGLKGYQHPSRFNSNEASLKADYFSGLIIYLSILGIAAKPELWDKYQVKNTQYLLFTEIDFENIESSQIFLDLKGCSTLVDSLLLILIQYLKTSHFTELKPLIDYLRPPEILKFEVDKYAIIQGVEVKFRWEVVNATKIVISPEIGEVDNVGEYSLKPENHKFTISADGFFETVQKELFLKSFPAPTIESLYVPTPNFSSKGSINHISLQTPSIKMSLPQLGFSKSFHFSIPLNTVNTYNGNINKIKPQYEQRFDFWGISKALDRVKEIVNRYIIQ